MVLTLYKLDASPPVRSVLMVIEAANITDVQYVNINVLKGDHLTNEYLKMNPQHTIPMLKDGDFTVWDRFVTTANDPVVYQGENFYRSSALLKIKTAYEFTDKFLTGKWLVGDEITLADICCVANISSLNEILPIDAELYPNLAQWLENCKEQEFYKKGNKPGLEEFSALLQSRLA
ncbi:Glutathione S-transferase 1 [Papilio xuthus]|uniref:Glutathione S-transferase 1 n=1 Tax=Papilio xuthus TaxID=66420 RepID=A0A194PNI6_PAPXU|nr:Glutathione S-transferase 1 [Papilio xuthus]